MRDSESFETVIVGSGFSGLAMAHRLKQAGREDFTILERARDVGGTWRDNTYPGCRCDIPSHLYSFSFAPNPDWSETYARQPENVFFSHITHVKRGRLRCDTCHGGIGASDKLPPYEEDRISGYSRDIWGAAGRPGMTMNDCIACHRKNHREDSCLDCHK